MLPKIEEIISKASELDWGTYIYPGDTTISFSQYSPAGEDFEFSVSCEDADSVKKGIRDYSEDFDIDDHVFELLKAKENGLQGVPPIDVLVEDAKEIQKMLEELVLAVC